MIYSRISSYLAYITRRSQDHLLGEICETDNSVKSLYEARKIESKLEQKTPRHNNPDRLVDVHVVKKGKSNYYSNCKFCGKSHDKGKCPAYGKTCNKCGGKNHFEAKCTQKGKRVRFKNPDKCKCCGGWRTKSHNFHEVECECEDQPNSMEDLTDQVQSLF